MEIWPEFSCGESVYYVYNSGNVRLAAAPHNVSFTYRGGGIILTMPSRTSTSAQSATILTAGWRKRWTLTYDPSPLITPPLTSLTGDDHSDKRELITKHGSHETQIRGLFPAQIKVKHQNILVLRPSSQTWLLTSTSLMTSINLLMAWSREDTAASERCSCDSKTSTTGLSCFSVLIICVFIKCLSASRTCIGWRWNARKLLKALLGNHTLWYAPCITTNRCSCSIELFQNMCAELKDWIIEKNASLNVDDLGKDLHSVQALQRKHKVW